MGQLIKDLKGLKNNEIITFYTKVGLSQQKGVAICKRDNVFLITKRDSILKFSGVQYVFVFGDKDKDYKTFKTVNEAIKELKKLKVETL
jgi:hypothetical protein